MSSETFLYNNVMYMAAGVATATAGEAAWEDLMRDRILKPLGMDSSSLSIRDPMSALRCST